MFIYTAMTKWCSISYTDILKYYKNGWVEVIPWVYYWYLKIVMYLWNTFEFLMISTLRKTFYYRNHFSNNAMDAI